jgi:uncharacterized phage-associated protein
MCILDLEGGTTMSSIRFRFDEDKLVQSLAFFSKRGVSDLTKLKAAKLLFYADKLHLNRYGRPILGDSYACMEHGPVPSLSLNEMNDAIDQCPEQRTEESSLLRVLVVRDGRYPSFELRHESLFDPDVFSESDLEILEEVVCIHGKKPAWQLREESHLEHAWKLANQLRPTGSSVSMYYENFFDAEHTDMLNLLLETQQDEDHLEHILAKAATNAA